MGYTANNNAIMANQTWPVITNEVTFLWILLLNTATTLINITTTTDCYENETDNNNSIILLR